MSEPVYKIGKPSEFSDEEKQQFLVLLIEQDKVQNPTIARISRCHFLGACFVDGKMTAIAAIKPKTASDFDPIKADLPEQADDFEFELGYCYTQPTHTGKGYSSALVKRLIDKTNAPNLMASTELKEDNPMLYILKKFDFARAGKPWNSGIHGGALGLFLKRG